jgi:hypothetical protein
VQASKKNQNHEKSLPNPEYPGSAHSAVPGATGPDDDPIFFQ